MSYTLFIQPKAERDLSTLSKEDFLRVDSRILKLKDIPRPVDCKKLKGRDGWRIRVGDYRVIYEIDDSRGLVLVLRVLHRKDAYR